MARRDIAVAGAGIGGLACAALLAQAGHRVVVFDKMPAPQPVGSGLILQPVGLAALDAIGVGARLRGVGARINRLIGRTAPTGRVVLDVRYSALRDDAHGVAIHRAALFDALLEAAQSAGADFRYRTAVSGVETGARPTLTFADGRRSAPFDLIVDALGARSPLSRPGKLLPYGALWANVDWRDASTPDALEQRYHRAAQMAGVMPIGRAHPQGPPLAAYFWSVKGAAFQAWRAAPLARWRDEARALWPQSAPFLDQITAHEDFIYAAYAHRTCASPIDRGVARVGDSWHATSPQLGQGANMALLDAFALATALAAQGDRETALGEYARLRLWHIRLYQAASFLFTPVYQSDSVILPWVRDAAMGPLSRLWPAPIGLASLVAGRIGAPLAAIARVRNRAEKEILCAAQPSSPQSARRSESFLEA